MKHRQLPQYLRERVRSFVQFKWLATRGVDEETILRGLPTDLRRDIQRHLCLDLVRRVSSSQQIFVVSNSASLSMKSTWRKMFNKFFPHAFDLSQISFLKHHAMAFSTNCRFLFSHKWMISYLMQYVSDWYHP